MKQFMSFLVLALFLSIAVSCQSNQPLVQHGGATPPPQPERPPTPEEFAKLSPRLQHKWIKKLSAPQYTNTLYFGHEKAPKKRPPHKQKYCTTCGLKH